MASVVSGLLASPLSERYRFDSITTHRKGSVLERVGVVLQGGGELLVWCAAHRGGLVHVHTTMRGSMYRKAVVILIARALRLPVLVHVHAGPGDIRAFAAALPPFARGFIRASLRRAQSIVSVSAASARAVEEEFGLAEVGVIPNAAPPRPAQVGSPPADAALFLGGFDNAVKGGRDLLDALPALLDAAPSLRIELAGPGDPPPELADLDGERVRWRGWLDAEAKRAALAATGIVLIPSRSEGLPVVLLEAMAYGRAVVATDVGGIPDLLRDDVDGLLVGAGDRNALVTAIARLADDPARVARYGQSARIRVSELDESEIVERVDAIYRALLTRSAHSREPPTTTTTRAEGQPGDR
jgi:glycosyltransferase involved in cell wall biosynthesis